MNKIIQGDALGVLQNPRDNNGRFVKGYHYAPKTEFKNGQHWKKKKPYWNRDWLYSKYIEEDKTVAQIAKEQKCGQQNISYFIVKHNIKKPINGICKRIRKQNTCSNKSWWPKHWDKKWLYEEYVIKKKPANEIAKDQDCSENNILYYLKKFNIPTRSMKEIRQMKRWGLFGRQNGKKCLGGHGKEISIHVGDVIIKR